MAFGRIAILIVAAVIFSSSATAQSVGQFIGMQPIFSSVGLLGSTSGTITIKPQATAGTYNFNLPTTAGSSGQFLTSGGGGTAAMTWSAPGVTIGTTIITSGTDKQVLFDDAGTVGESAGFTFNKTSNALTLGSDVTLVRDAAGVIAQRNGVNAQKLRVYNTFTDASNGSWFEIDTTTANTSILATNGNGTGAATMSKLQFNVLGVNKLDYNVTNPGDWTISSNIRALNLNASQNIFTGVSGVFAFGNTRSSIKSPSDGIITLLDSNQSAFVALQFGGTTAVFPEMKRSAATLAFRLADDTADANISAAQITGSTAPIFLTLTGYLKGAGASAVTAAATVPSADFADGNTGTGAVAHATSPTFVTPALGAATATSVVASANLNAGTTIKTGGFTVAGLPAAGTAGRRAYITDQLTACVAAGAAITGGGAIVCPVFDNGTAWVGD